MKKRNKTDTKFSTVEFLIGSDLINFKEYYLSLTDLNSYYKSLGRGTRNGNLGRVEENHIKNDPDHLIVMQLNSKVIGHAIWHESSTEEHLESDPRDLPDQQILRAFFQGKGNFAELHELWLKTQYRNRGIGKLFFEFFEDFIKKRGFPAIVYYTDNPAAVAMCRKRGYRESFLKEENLMVFYLPLSE